MTQYDDIKRFIESHPGTTRGMMRRHLPHITHENEILKKIIKNGGYRERVKTADKWGNERETWGYYVK